MESKFICEVTNNPCGTDTWMMGHDCTCSQCTLYVKEINSSVPAKVWVKEGGSLPEQAHSTDVGSDLSMPEDFTIRAGEFKMVSLNIVVKPPSGYHFEVVPRSSTFKKFGLLLVNSVGIIDETYSGENDILRALVYRPLDVDGMNTVKNNDQEITIKKGTRLFQIIPRKTVRLRWVDMTGLPFEDADRGGIGSTGV